MISPLELHAALTCYTANGFVTVQVKSYADDGDLGYSVAHHPYGFRGRPLPADQDNADNGGQVLFGFEGDRGHALLLLEDWRLLSKLPDEGDGGSMQYATTADGKLATFVLSGTDGSAKLRVDDQGGPIRLEHGATGPSVEVNETTVDVGGTTGSPVLDGFVIFDPGGALTAWVQAVSAATNVPAPPLFVSTKVRIMK